MWRRQDADLTASRLLAEGLIDDRSHRARNSIDFETLRGIAAPAARSR